MHMFEYLDQIHGPKDLKDVPLQALPQVCEEIREYLIQTLAGTGGHFSSNLGIIELTVAIHYVYNSPIDRIVWDVGHQTYPHKILTGRKTSLPTIRKYMGISGFPKREESEYDTYNTGHAGTSISQLLGEAIGRDLAGEKYHCLAIIGDASIATGMALEAMNHGGHVKPNCLVVLNDNYMSISKNTGSISNYLNNIITSHFFNYWRKLSFTFLKWLPLIGPAMGAFFKRVEKGFKDVFTPGALFEDLGFHYIGPTDGHDVLSLVKLLNKIKNLEGPVLLHVLTQKGKGYDPAEKDPVKFHGVSPFKIESGQMISDGKSSISLSQLIGEVLIAQSGKNEKIVAITPAMIEGSGLSRFADQYPDRLFDVGIAEQHAVAFAGALCHSKRIPFLCIYSTFLTRGLDQVVQDVSLMNHPVRFVIDRAGCVGPDGETHQGLSDLGYLLALPKFEILLPSSVDDVIDAMYYLESQNDGPSAMRFPKYNIPVGDIDFHTPKKQLPPKGEFRVIGSGSRLCIVSNGFFLSTAKELAEKLLKKNIHSTILDLIWIKPLNTKLLDQYIGESDSFIIIDENYKNSGISGYLLNLIHPELLSRFLGTFAFPEEAIIHGDRNRVLDHYGLSPDKIADAVLKKLDIN